MSLDDVKISELKAAHPEGLICVNSPHGELVFRKPKRLEFDQWSDSRDKPSVAGLALARQCLVFPSQQELMATLDAAPGILGCKNGIVDSITDLAMADGGVTAKKL